MLIISPNSPMHLTVRKGKWVYIPARDEGGFQGKKIGDHRLAGAAAQQRRKKSANGKGLVTLNELRLFNLKSDVCEKQSVADGYPEVVARLQKQAEIIRRELGDVRTTGTDQRKINLVDPQER
jgi:hypothetical protein